MLFDNYRHTPNAKLNYDLDKFNYIDMRNIVVKRMVERGWPQDWYAILNLYGEGGVKEAVKSFAYIHEKDMNFVSIVFQTPLQQLNCYKKKR